MNVIQLGTPQERAYNEFLSWWLPRYFPQNILYPLRFASLSVRFDFGRAIALSNIDANVAALTTGRTTVIDNTTFSNLFTTITDPVYTNPTLDLELIVRLSNLYLAASVQGNATNPQIGNGRVTVLPPSNLVTQAARFLRNRGKTLLAEPFATPPFISNTWGNQPWRAAGAPFQTQMFGPIDYQFAARSDGRGGMRMSKVTSLDGPNATAALLQNSNSDMWELLGMQITLDPNPQAVVVLLYFSAWEVTSERLFKFVAEVPLTALVQANVRVTPFYD